MNNNNTQCPACHAPYNQDSYSEHSVTCLYCGFEVVMKLKHDDEIENLAFEYANNLNSQWTCIIGSLLTMIVFLPYTICGGLRCWENGYTGWGITLLVFSALLIMSGLVTPFAARKNVKEHTYYAENCNYSIATLEKQLEEEKNPKKKRYLEQVKKAYNEIKNKILTR